MPERPDSEGKENDVYSLKDVLEFLENDAKTFDELTEEFALHGELTTFGTTYAEESALRKQAVEGLKHNDVKPAIKYLEREIELYQELIENPFKNLGPNYVSKDPAERERLIVSYTKRLERYTKNRSAID